MENERSNASFCSNNPVASHDGQPVDEENEGKGEGFFTAEDVISHWQQSGHSRSNSHRSDKSQHLKKSDKRSDFQGSVNFLKCVDLCAEGYFCVVHKHFLRFFFSCPSFTEAIPLCIILKYPYLVTDTKSFLKAPSAPMFSKFERGARAKKNAIFWSKFSKMFPKNAIFFCLFF